MSNIHIYQWNTLNTRDKYQKTNFNDDEKCNTLTNNLPTDAHLIVLQEVSPNILEKLVKVSTTYEWLPTAGHNGWLVVIGMNKKLLSERFESFHSINFGEEMGSGKAVGMIVFDSFIIAGVHLPFYERGGPEAFTQIQEMMDKWDPANKRTRIVVGDFNLDYQNNAPPKETIASMESLIQDSTWVYGDKELNVKTTKCIDGSLRNLNHLIYRKTPLTKVEILEVNPLWEADNNLTSPKFPSDHTMVEFVVQFC